MQLKIIQDLPHIVQGKASTPASEVISQARQRINEAQAMLASLAQAAIDKQNELEAVLLRGEPSGSARLEIASIAELSIDQQHEIADAQFDIDSVNRMLDQHRATQISAADKAVIDALTEPFTKFLQEQRNVNN